MKESDLMADAMLKRAAPPSEAVSSLGEFLRANRTAISVAWAERQSGPRPLLSDHLLTIIDRLADMLVSGECAAPEASVIDALADGPDLVALIGEYADLRSVVFDLWENDPDHTIRPSETQHFNDALDRAIAASVEGYVSAKKHAAVALDRVAESDGERSGDRLERLTRAVFELAEAIDSVEIFGKDCESLEAWASFGIEKPESERSRSASLALALNAAREQRALDLSLTPRNSDGETSHEPSALHALPLIRGEAIIGVLVVGSRTVAGFSDADKALLASASGPAAAQLLRARTDRVARQTGEFVQMTSAILGHDLRNPLNIITLGASALKSSPLLDDRQRKNLQRIEDQAQRMARMISDFLDLTRSQLGDGIPVNPRPMDFGQVLRSVVENIEATNPGRTVRIRTSGGTFAKGDPDRVMQVTTNLIANAIQHGADIAPVTVALTEEPDTLVLEVHNDGDPIPPDLLPHIFEPFRRGNGQKREKKPATGLGLGLYIVREIVKAHRGSVTVRSVPGEGTTLRVTWPKA